MSTTTLIESMVLGQFVGKSFAFRARQHAASETDFLVHHAFLDVIIEKPLRPAMPVMGRFVSRGVGPMIVPASSGRFVLRDVDRNVLRAARSDGLIVEHACAGIREFADFAVAHVFDRGAPATIRGSAMSIPETSVQFS